MTESEAERRANLAMIEEKALGLLSRNERHRLRMACSAYGARQINVDRFIHTLVGLLGTPNKMTFLVELRELIRDEDKDYYDQRVFVPAKPLRAVQFQTENGFDFEMTDLDGSSQCLLQISKSKSVPKIRELVNGCSSKRVKESRPKDGRGLRAFKESRIALPHLADLTSAFPFAGPAPQTCTEETKSIKKQRSIQPSTAKQPAIPQQQQQLEQQLQQQQNLIKKLRRSVAATEGLTEELLRVAVPKKSPNQSLGLTIEGGADTKHRLPRIINIDGKGTAFETAGLKVGQTIVEVDGVPMEGLSHDEAARAIAKAYARRGVGDLILTVTANSIRAHAERYRPNS